MKITSNVVISDLEGNVLYSGHNVATLNYANILLKKLAGDSDVANAHTIKYVLFGNPSTITPASVTDTQMDTASSDLHVYSFDSKTLTEATEASPTAAYQYTFTVPQADTFSYSELGLAGDIDSSATFDADQSQNGYVLFARHTLSQANVKTSSMTLVINWTVYFELDTSA